MADDDGRPVSGLPQPVGDASGKPVVALAVGGLEIPFVFGETRAHARADLAAVEPIPRAQRDLAQAVVEPWRRVVPETCGDDLGGAARPAERAGDDGGAGGLRHGAEAMP